MNKKYYVLGADNVSRDISMAEFETYDEAYSSLEERYQDILDVCEDEVFKKRLSKTSAEILLSNGDFYYWNLKTSG